MKTILRAALSLFLVGAAPALVAGCATGKTAPSAPVELNGTKWKLVMLGGKLDGRVVEFKKKGKDGYVGTLIDLGKRLENLPGITVGYEVFSMRKKSENQYHGMYKSITADGNIDEKDLTLFVDGDSFSWNQESAIWERIRE